MHKNNPEDAETADEDTTEGDDAVEEDESDICQNLYIDIDNSGDVDEYNTAGTLTTTFNAFDNFDVKNDYEYRSIDNRELDEQYNHVRNEVSSDELEDTINPDLDVKDYIVTEKKADPAKKPRNTKNVKKLDLSNKGKTQEKKSGNN